MHEIVPRDLVQITVTERFHIGRAFADGEMLERVLTENVVFAEHCDQVVAGAESDRLMESCEFRRKSTYSSFKMLICPRDMK